VEARVALDTNRINDLFRGDVELAERLGAGEEVWIPFVVLGEMKAGFQGGTQQRRDEVLLNRLLAKPTVGVLLPGLETAEHYARLFVQLERAGTPIPDNDLWVAALVLQHNLFLVARDHHFERIPQLMRA
jgi:predicted nucleic acid-binding protein